MIDKIFLLLILKKPLNVNKYSSKYYLNVRNWDEKNGELSEETGAVIKECFFEYVIT